MQIRNALVAAAAAYNNEVSARERVRIRLDYSGRGMYGESCVGIVGSYNHCLFVVHEAANKLDAKYKKEILVFRQDSMGLDVIFYWPGH